MIDARDPIEVGPLRVRVVYDETPSDPREWDNLGVMVTWHDRYNLGDHSLAFDADVNLRYNNYPSMRNFLIAEYDALIETVMPLYLYDHSGITMNVGGFSDPWDSGQVGVIFTTAAKIDETGSADYYADPENIRKVLTAEVETYDLYLRGEVYGYVVETADGEHVDSCWGYFDTDEAAAEGRSIAESDPAFLRVAVASFAAAEGLGL